MKKSIIALLLCVLFILAGCGGQKADGVLEEAGYCQIQFGRCFGFSDERSDSR